LQSRRSTPRWDPLGRRGYSQAPGAANPTYMYYDDGGNPILEWSSVTQRRYVPSGIGDTPVVWYEGADESTPRWLHNDGLGSPLAYSDASGIASTPMGYDAYGLQPSWTAAGRYTYTGQTTAFTNQLIDYKARMYDPNLGRFLEPDPIGQAGGVNIYAYVGNDPLNFLDPSGEDCLPGGNTSCPTDVHEIVVVANRTPPGQSFLVWRPVTDPVLAQIQQIEIPTPVAEITVMAAKRKQCSDDPRQSGEVHILGVDGTGTGGVGFSVGAGAFYTDRGDIGVYFTRGLAGGPPGVSGTIVAGFSNSLAAFQGPSEGATLSGGEELVCAATVTTNASGHTFTVGGGVGGGVPVNLQYLHVTTSVASTNLSGGC
jgi:RHS repeat-associated protein